MGRFSTWLLSSTLLSTGGAVASYAEEAETLTQPDHEVILVSGRRIDQTLDDVAGSISVVTQEDIERQLVTNMSELFDRDPSVDVTGDVGDAQNFRVRGMGGDRVLMIKDGMRLNEGYGANGLNDIVGRGFVETENLKQVEVAKGAVSSLYGSDALGGVVIFTTKDPSDYLDERDRYLGVRGGFTTRSDEYNAGFTGAIRTGAFESMASYTYRDGGEYKNHADEQAELDITSHSGLVKSRFNLSNGDYIQASVELYDQDVERPDSGQINHGSWRGLLGYDIVTQTSSEEKDSGAYKLSFVSERTTAFYDYLNVSAYFQTSEQYNESYMQLDIDSPYTSYKGTRDMWDYNTYQQETWGFISSVTKSGQWGGLDQVVGYGLDIETTQSSRTAQDYRIQAGEVIKDETERPFPENDTLRVGAYIFDEFTLFNGDLTITPGARWDYYKLEPNNDLTGTATEFEEISENRLSPNLSIVYQLNETLSVFAQYGEGFKVPPYDLAYIYHDNSIFGYKVIPAEDLDPETSRSYEIGLRRQTDRARFSLSAYYNDYENFIDIDIVGTEPGLFPGSIVTINQYRNIDAVTIKGVEAAFEVDLGQGFDVFGNLAWQDGEDQTADEYLTTIAPVNGTLGVGYRGDVWSGEAVTRWADDMNKVNPGDQTTPAWGVLDLTARYEPSDRWSLSAGIHNVLDTRYVEYASVAGLSTRNDLTQFERGGRAYTIQLRADF